MLVLGRVVFTCLNHYSIIPLSMLKSIQNPLTKPLLFVYKRIVLPYQKKMHFVRDFYPAALHKNS